MFKTSLIGFLVFLCTISCSAVPEINPDEQAVRKVVKHLKRRFAISLKEYRVNINNDKNVMTIILNIKKDFDKDYARRVMLMVLYNVLYEFNNHTELEDEVLVYPLHDNNIEIEIFPVPRVNETVGAIRHAWLSHRNICFYLQGKDGQIYEDAETLKEAAAYVQLKYPKFYWPY